MAHRSATTHDSRPRRIKIVLLIVSKLCRRAAHFAHFSSEGDDERNPHVGGSNARELGPWSSAVELADAREAAMARREEEMRARTSNDEQENEENTWTPHAYPGKAGNRLSAVPPLADLALDTVVSLMEDVESLAGLPDTVMVGRQVGNGITRSAGGGQENWKDALALDEIQSPELWLVLDTIIPFFVFSLHRPKSASGAMPSVLCHPMLSACL